MRKKNTLWRIPAFGILAGVIWFFLNSHFLGSLSLVTLPDNTVTVDPLRSLIMDLVVMAITYLYCWQYVTPKMTRKEVLKSSLVLVGFMAVSVGIKAFLVLGGSPMAQMAGFYLSEPFVWCSFVYHLMYIFTGSEWLSMAIQCLSPLVFVPLGKKDLPDFSGED